MKRIKKEKIKRIIIKKYIVFPNKVSAYISIFLGVLILLNLVGMIYSIDLLNVHQNNISKIEGKILKIEESVSAQKGNDNVENVNDYYRELSDKTDEAINRILTIVGMLSAIITFFGFLLTFKAPKDIEKRLDELNLLISKADQAANDSIYQAKVLEALNVDYDGELTNSKRLKQLTEVIKKYPEKPDAYMHRGFLYDEMSKKASMPKRIQLIHCAIADYEIARNLGADMSSYFNDMGVAYSRLNKHHEAISFFSKAIKISPDDAAAYSNRGSSYDDIGEYEKALKDYEQALNLDFESDDALYNRAMTYLALGKKEKELCIKKDHFELAINDLETAYEINPEKSKYIEQLVRIHSTLKGIYISLSKNETNIELKSIYENYAMKNEVYMNKWLQILAKGKSNIFYSQNQAHNTFDSTMAQEISKSNEQKGEKKSFIATDEDGNKTLFEILFTFDDEDTGKSYIVYTDNSKDESGNINVYANIDVFDPITQNHLLKAIESDREWKLIEEILSELQKCIKNGMDTDRVGEYIEKFMASKYTKICELLNNGIEAYQEGKLQIAEEAFLEVYSLDKNNESAKNNLAYMKRRGETMKTNIPIEELLSFQNANGFNDINLALCYIEGFEVEKNWENALELICKCESDYADVKSWWGNENIVGKKESNIVLLLLLIYNKEKGIRVDQKELENRLEIALQDGYDIPYNIQ